MKIFVNKKFNKVLDDYYLEASTKKKGKTIIDNYYGFSEKQVKNNFKKDFKVKFKTNENFKKFLKSKYNKGKTAKLGDFYFKY